jgi:hypothetical protein
MSIEHLVREYYNEMYRIHTQPGNAYDAGDDLYHLTVHKHLDQDPLIQFREAFGLGGPVRGPAHRRCRTRLWGFCRSLWRSKPRLSKSMVMR